MKPTGDNRYDSKSTNPKFSNESPGPYDKDKKEKPYYSKFVKPATSKKESDWRKLIDEMNNRYQKVKNKIKGNKK